MCLTMVATPQDVLESDLNHLAKKAVGETLASEQTLRTCMKPAPDRQRAQALPGTLAFYLRGRDEAELDRRGLDLANVMLNAGLQPVRETTRWRRSTATCAGCRAATTPARTGAGGTRN